MIRKEHEQSCNLAGKDEVLISQSSGSKGCMAAPGCKKPACRWRSPLLARASFMSVDHRRVRSADVYSLSSRVDNVAGGLIMAEEAPT